MKNSDMKRNRFLIWANARAKVAKIQAHLKDGGVVVIANHMRAVAFTKAAQAAMFEARKNGAFMRQGKSMVCFDGNAIKLGRKV